MTSFPQDRKIFFLVLSVAFLGVPMDVAYSQSRIQGTVQDAKDGTPLPNVNVFLEGTTYGTATDSDGRFTLTGIEPGSYAIVVSMVGYSTKRKPVQLYDPSGPERDTSKTLTVKLSRTVKEMKGISVQADREKWLDRLDQFRSSFLDDVPHAADCEFVNPEVLSFEQRENGLVAHAKKPLRIRNEGLGYEVTYHVTQYRAGSGARHRYGKFEFDPLEPEDQDQRNEWKEARRRSYRGSFQHFVRTLQSGSLKEEGFQVGLTSSRTAQPPRRGPAQSEPEPVDRGSLFESAPSPNRGILKLPTNKFLEVRYVEEGEAHQFARRFRNRSPRSTQRSWVQIVGGSYVLVSTQSGDFVRQDTPGFGYYALSGYWGWYETAATVLPADYQPSDGR